MSNSAIWEVASAVILSVGGGGALVAALSSWLGRAWATRLMARETAAHERALAELRSNLSKDHDKATHLFRQKIELYKEVSSPLIELVTHAQLNGGTIAPDVYARFEKDRLKSTALLAMFAPSEVFDSHNAILDYVFDTIDGKAQWSFPHFRTMALSMLSLMRRDVGLYADSVSYSGGR